LTSQTLLFISPPFTQLNTPYPATQYLTGYFESQQVLCHQADLGIEVILQIFSKNGLTQLFKEIKNKELTLSENSQRIVCLEKYYIETIEQVVSFLQHKDNTLAYNIAEENFLPKASRFDQIEDLDWAFGSLGTRDKARHFATLYLEDLSDLIIETVDPFFGFSRYAEKLGLSAKSFDHLYNSLQEEDTFVDRFTLALLDEKLKLHKPTLVGFSVPFPGNLYSAFRCAQFIKKHYPHIKTTMGGGFPNTELRSLSDVRVFEFFDFITLDDGETPISELIKFLDGKILSSDLKRTFLLENNQVVYQNGSKLGDVSFSKMGTPSYKELPLDKYLSVLEVANPMHRLWSDGRWNKLTLAHGCYWKKCSFCDISLDYIQHYEPLSAKLICDRIENLIAQTGESGFHFVDEAAPPAVMRELAIEILHRGLSITWWTNIRFEQSFNADLCRLLKASGCIAVSGGLEVASDRLLAMMKKGVSVEQVSQVADNFTQAGIMVHAYLMYGFPTQTAQETIDSLEVVRQMFENGVLQSAFWHRFTMTAHSPVGLNPSEYQVVNVDPEIGTFANNDLTHEDPTGADHALFSEGLRTSLFNYMHGICFENDLASWFSFEVPETTLSPDLIGHYLENKYYSPSPNARVLWLGNSPILTFDQKTRRGVITEIGIIRCYNKSETFEVSCQAKIAQWIYDMLILLENKSLKTSLSDFQKSYESHFEGEFTVFTQSKIWASLREHGLIIV